MRYSVEAALDANGVTFDARAAKLGALMHVSGLTIPACCFGSREDMVGREFSITKPKRGRASREVTGDDYDEAMRVLYETDRFYELMRLFPRADKHIDLFARRGFMVSVVSGARGLTEERFWWLVSRFRLAVKEFVPLAPGESKSSYYAQCRIVIDDEVRHLTALVGDGTVPILMLPPSNAAGSQGVLRPDHLHSDINISRGWEAAGEHVRRRVLTA